MRIWSVRCASCATTTYTTTLTGSPSGSASLWCARAVRVAFTWPVCVLYRRCVVRPSPLTTERPSTGLRRICSADPVHGAVKLVSRRADGECASSSSLQSPSVVMLAVLRGQPRTLSSCGSTRVAPLHAVFAWSCSTRLRRFE